MKTAAGNGESRRHRVLRGARARILAGILVLLVASESIALLASREILDARAGERVDDALSQEAQEFRTLVRDGRNPNTGERFGTDLRAIFDVFLSRNVPAEGEAVYTFLADRPYRATAAARAAGIHEVLAALPDGYDTRIGTGGRRLSGGERRRLAIARALVRDTPVLVLDEPTTGLDEAARDALLEPLRRLVRGRSTIVITHDPAVVAWADRVVGLRDGHVEEAAVMA